LEMVFVIMKITWKPVIMMVLTALKVYILNRELFSFIKLQF
jgi:hypothetical protein